MDIVITADRASIARLLSDYTRCPVKPEDIEIAENPDESGSLSIGWHFDHFEQRFVLSPGGEIAADRLDTLD